MKVSIIGGGGLVGSMTAYALQLGGVASSICTIDANKDMSQGVALDLLHGASFVADQRISAGDMSDVKSSNVVVVTAGLRRKPEESRLDLINRNVDLFMNLLGQMKQAGFKDNTYLVIVSNPVDVLTYLAVKHSGLPAERVLGLGTVLDTARFQSYIAQKLHTPATQVKALILGEHGDSMTPIWSSATVGGLPLEQWPGWTAKLGQEVFDATKAAGATVIKLKGGSGFAVGVSIREVVHSLLLDSRKVLPVSSLMKGEYGVGDVCLSVPTEVGCGGVRRVHELALTPRERLGIQNSARVLRETIDAVEKRLAGAPAKTGPAVVTQNPTTLQGRVIPRGAWAGKKN